MDVPGFVPRDGVPFLRPFLPPALVEDPADKEHHFPEPLPAYLERRETGIAFAEKLRHVEK